MSTARKYKYGGDWLTIKEIQALKQDASSTWIQRRLNKGYTVAQVLEMPVLTLEQCGRRGRKQSHWS